MQRAENKALPVRVGLAGSALIGRTAQVRASPGSALAPTISDWSACCINSGPQQG